MYDDDDDEEFFTSRYEDGHWKWSEITNELMFMSHVIETVEQYEIPMPATIGTVEFRDDIDLIEQQKLKKRFQRKVTGDDDVVVLQDIKDIVLFTSPPNVFNTPVVYVLHLQTTDRFIRALIFYCQYYLQISDEMNRRLIEQETKIPTIESVNIELNFRDELKDLRLIVAKEYCAMIMGDNEFKKVHHMGPNKKRRSLSKKEANLFESVLRISIQIVWLALGRKSLNQIELEVHRLFKSQIFNIIEHQLKTAYVSKMDPQEQRVLLGDCIQHRHKFNTQAPLMNEIRCHRDIDFRLLALGNIKFKRLTSRQLFLEKILTEKESSFCQLGITLGILGMLRSRFDTMLRPIKISASTASSTASVRARSASKTSRSSTRKSIGHVPEAQLIPNVNLPPTTNDKLAPCYMWDLNITRRNVGALIPLPTPSGTTDAVAPRILSDTGKSRPMLRPDTTPQMDHEGQTS